MLLVFSIIHAQDTPPNPTVTTLVEGLRNPAGLALLPDGSLLIAEEGTGNDDLSAGVSLRLPDGTVGRLISGIRSSRDSGDLSGVALVGVAPDQSQIYVGNFAQGHLWTLPIPEDGFNQLPDIPFTSDDLGKAMEIFNRVTLTNPFDITFDESGVPIVADASQNGVAKELPSGKVLYIHRFAELINPLNELITIDPVPTGIERVGDEYYVTLTGGCPYPQGGGELVAIDESRNQRTVIDNLNMPIDVMQADDGTIYVLEFAKFLEDGNCFSGSGYLPNTGRLSRITDSGDLETIVDNLDFPVSAVVLPDGSLYVSQIFDGEIIHITFNEAVSNASFQLPQLIISEPTYNTIDDVDGTLHDIIEEQNLTPYFGQHLREDETELSELGRNLFFDPILSGDQNISCATCHHPEFAMTDNRVLPIGSGGHGLGSERDFLETITMMQTNGDLQTVENPSIGQFVPRNSPTIINSALLNQQFWDGRVQTYALGGEVSALEKDVSDLQLTDVLATQALFPITSRVEMGGMTFGNNEPQYIRVSLVNRLKSNTTYAEQFASIYGDDEITPTRMVEALAAFERQLIFVDSAWDDYIAGDTDALNNDAKRGALLFYGALNDAVNCATCHSGDMFTDGQFYNLLVPQLGPGKGNGDNGREDWGRANVTFDWRDRYTFRTAPLRNVALTTPYFHSGAYATLEDVIWHHANIWERASNYDPSAHLPDDFYSSVRNFDGEAQSVTISEELANGMPLTDKDVAHLVAFLESLTDPEAEDLSYLTPDRVPSGLALDPISTSRPDVIERDDNDLARPDTEAIQDDGTDWRFVNVTNEIGLDFVHGAFQFGLYKDPIAMMGAGLCWIDYDNNGWLDLYLVNSHAEDEYDQLMAQNDLPTNALYRNVNGQFERITAGDTDLVLRGNGCVAADFNMDGWTDLYITADGEDVLLQNTGGSFEQRQNTGIITPEWNTAASVADLNNDGLPDLFVGGYIDLDNKIERPFGAFPQDYYGIPDRLFLNTGNFTFKEATLDVGLARNERTLGAIFTDADRDGDLDIYIANDGQPNRMYEYVPDENARYGFRYIDLTNTAEVGDSGSGMGVTSADYDGDGMFDLFVTNWEAELNALYRNETHEEGIINYRYSTYRIGMRGLGNNMTGWGTHWADFDHDTDIDLVTVNGRVPVSNFETDPELVRFYGNRLVEKGRAEYFEWTEQVGLEDVGTLLARGSAVADYDNDGDLDIAINSIGGRAILLETQAITGNWLQLKFDKPMAGLIAELTLPDGQILVRELHIGSSYLASEDPSLHFGLGEITQVSKVVILYHDDVLITLDNVSTNQVIRVGMP